MRRKCFPPDTSLVYKPRPVVYPCLFCALERARRNIHQDIVDKCYYAEKELNEQHDERVRRKGLLRTVYSPSNRLGLFAQEVRRTFDYFPRHDAPIYLDTSYYRRYFPVLCGSCKEKASGFLTHLVK